MFQSGQLGLLVQYILGAFLDWWWISLASLLFLLPFLVLFVFMPDSPASLVSRGQRMKAEAASKWLHSSCPAPEDDNRDNKIKSGENIQKGTWDTVRSLTKPENLRPFCVSVSVQGAMQLSGSAPLLFFSVQFFKDAAL